MPSCTAIDHLVTAYVDGEIAAADRRVVDDHLRACSGCRQRIAAEQAVSDLCRERKSNLTKPSAPETLRASCQRLAAAAEPSVRTTPRTISWRSRFAPLAAAATLVLIVGAAFLYQMTSRSNRVMAAELTADHLKCFALNTILRTHQAASVVESSMATGFGWQAQLPRAEVDSGLELVGSRPCLYGQGRVAHIMYRHDGQPVSLFMLPKTTRTEELLDVLGHRAAIWSIDDRTFVLIARETRAEIEQLAGRIRASLR
jgi:anti-sigma factor RsiW